MGRALEDVEHPANDERRMLLDMKDQALSDRLLSRLHMFFGARISCAGELAATAQSHPPGGI